MAESVKKYRTFTGILYPDATDYKCDELLETLSLVFEEWAYVLHDKDVLETGEVKKAHYHWVGRRKNPVALKTIANGLQLRETQIEYIKHGWRAAVRYLTHIDHDHKYQYPADDVKSNFDVARFLIDEMSGEDMAKSIFKFLCDTGCVSPIQLTRWAIDNGSWSELRRAFPLWSAIMTENKIEFEQREMVKKEG